MVQGIPTFCVCMQKSASGRKIAVQDHCTCSQLCSSSVLTMHHRPCCCLQIALMAKAMAVAVLGDEVLVPRGYRHSGLVWIYIAICGSIPAQVGLWWAADSFITGEAGTCSSSGAAAGAAAVLLCILHTNFLHATCLLRLISCQQAPAASHCLAISTSCTSAAPQASCTAIPVSPEAAYLQIGPVPCLFVADPNSVCWRAWIAGMQREPEAAGSSRTDSSSPLLEKGLGSGSSSTDAGGKPEQGAAAPAQESKVAPKVVRALLGMSAVDTPLILVAFAAGEGPTLCTMSCSLCLPWLPGPYILAPAPCSGAPSYRQEWGL